MSSNDDILHLYYIRLYVGLQVYYLSINELKLLTNLEKYFMSSSRRPRLVAALLFFVSLNMITTNLCSVYYFGV